MSQSDPAWFEAQYNARAAVPDHGEYIDRWRTASRRVRLELPCYLDVPYGTTPGERVDVFPARRPGPLLVFVHGGYWRSLDKSDFSFVARAFVRAGVTVAVPNYDLAPAVSIETIVRQMLGAHAWLHRNAARYGADPERLYTSGHSAGGHLAAMMLAANFHEFERGLPRDLVRGALAVSGIYDIEPLRHTAMNPDLRIDTQSAHRLSPATYVPERAVPLVTAVGALESSEFHRQGRLLAGRWPRCFRECLVVPGCHHFSVVDALADERGVLHQAALDLMR